MKASLLRALDAAIKDEKRAAEVEYPKLRSMLLGGFDDDIYMIIQDEKNHRDTLKNIRRTVVKR